MFHRRRDTPGYIPMTSSSQSSGYLRSTLAELAIKESGDESEEAAPAILAEQRSEAECERDTACYSARCEQNHPGSSRSPGASRRDTPAYIYDSTKRMKSAFNCSTVAENLIAEEAEATTEEKSTDKLESKSKKEKLKHKQKQGQAANKEPKTPRRKISVGPTEAPAINHLTETCANAKSKN